MKMKVRATKLKAAVQKHVEQEKRRFEKETIAFELAAKKAADKYIENVASYLASLRNGNPRRNPYGLSDFLERGCKFPSQPKKPETHDALLVKLDLAEDQILDVDDRSDYMRFLDGKCICR